MRRGAALSDSAAGVLVCLMAADGAALLHRVPRLNDPELTEQEVGWGGTHGSGCGLRGGHWLTPLACEACLYRGRPLDPPHHSLPVCLQVRSTRASIDGQQDMARLALLPSALLPLHPSSPPPIAAGASPLSLLSPPAGAQYL